MDLLFAQNEPGLYMFDQHAAQERIKYEQFKVEIGQVGRVSQPLMVLILLEFSIKDSVKLEERLPSCRGVWNRDGAVWAKYIPNSIASSVDLSRTRKGDYRRITDFIWPMRRFTVANKRSYSDMMSCKGSIKANHHLSGCEARQLLVDFSQM